MVVSRLKNYDVIGSEIGFHEYSKAVCVYRCGCCCGVYGCYGDTCRLYRLMQTDNSLIAVERGLMNFFVVIHYGIAYR